MGEYSWFWENLSPGDANQAPYSSAEFSAVFRHFLNADRTVQGVIAGVDNELAVTGASSPVSVATGAAIVLGRLYQNLTSAVTVAVPTPAVSSRIDVICLQSDTAAQTVRAGRHAGVEGGGTPALTQTDALWEIPLANCTITTAGVITLTDVRRMARTPLAGGVQWAYKDTSSVAGSAGAWATVTLDSSLTLTAGKWLIWGTMVIKGVTTAGLRRARIYDSTSAATITAAQVTLAIDDFYAISLAPVVYTPTAAFVPLLQVYALEANDQIAGLDLNSARTSMVAQRIP